MNKSTQDTYVEALTKNGVPDEIAEKAAEIITKDDAALPNLGRSEQEQEVIEKTLPYLQGNQ